ncbi:hypothetical protein RJ640_027527 [Escallonia rubra]|uniref:Uncharacterized protein n=1 Tax=Escallonia rubra TaxID=112253 RepID=A0AA88UJX7_9ASTE|nr:hypothetical protein RJ640_027527 [Escallonia rubra]
MVSEHEICDDKYKPRMSSKKAHQGRKEEQWTSIFSWPVTVIRLQGCKKVDCPPQCTCGCFIACLGTYLHTPEKIAARLNLVPIVPEVETSLFNLGTLFRASRIRMKFPSLSPHGRSVDMFVESSATVLYRYRGALKMVMSISLKVKI